MMKHSIPFCFGFLASARQKTALEFNFTQSVDKCKRNMAKICAKLKVWIYLPKKFPLYDTMPTLIMYFITNSYKAHLNVATSPAGMNLWLLKNLYPMSASNVPDTTARGDHTQGTSCRHSFDKRFTLLLCQWQTYWRERGSPWGWRLCGSLRTQSEHQT